MSFKKIGSNVLSAAVALVIFGVFLGAAFSFPSWAMDDKTDAQDSSFIPLSLRMDQSLPTDDLKKFSQFQKNIFLRLTEKAKKEWKTYLQMCSDELRESPEAHPENKRFVSYQAVEGIGKIKEIFTALLDTGYLAFLDLDQTLFFSGPNGWLYCCLNKPLEKMEKSIFQLLLRYGFSSKTEFDNWGNLKFPVPITKVGPDYKFYDQPHVLDPNIPQILKNWHDQNVNIFGLTSRNSLGSTYTKESLETENIYIQELSHIQIKDAEVRVDFDQCIESGVIYTSFKNKFGESSAGLKFFEVYLEKLLTKSSRPSNIEVIVADNSLKVFSEIVSKSNIDELKRLEEKFKVQIQFKFFQPVEEHWLAPECDDIWNTIDPAIREKAIFETLQEFLSTFCKPLDTPLSGPFQID